MANLIVQDLPDTLYIWLLQQAETNHRSLQQEVVVLLEAQHKQMLNQSSRPSVEEIMGMARQFAELPEIEQHGESDSLGYDEFGLPC